MIHPIQICFYSFIHNHKYTHLLKLCKAKTFITLIRSLMPMKLGTTSSSTVSLSSEYAHNSNEDIQCVHVNWNCSVRESKSIEIICNGHSLRYWTYALTGSNFCIAKSGWFSALWTILCVSYSKNALKSSSPPYKDIEARPAPSAVVAGKNIDPNDEANTTPNPIANGPPM